MPFCSAQIAQLGERPGGLEADVLGALEIVRDFPRDDGGGFAEVAVAVDHVQSGAQPDTRCECLISCHLPQTQRTLGGAELPDHLPHLDAGERVPSGAKRSQNRENLTSKIRPD